METIEQEGNLTLQQSSIDYLVETRKWTMFIAIVGFIFLGLSALIVPFVGIFSGVTGQIGVGALTAIPMLIILLIYFFPIYYLYKFSSYAKQAERSLDPIAYDNAFLYLKKHYRFVAILLIVILSLYVLFGLVALIGVALS